MLKYLSLFLIAALSLALIPFNLPFVPLDGSTPLAPVKIQDATLQNPTVRVDPTQSVVMAGDTFTVTVMIDNANDLGGFQFDMLFSASTVTVNSVTLGGFLGSTGRTVIPLGPTIDNQAGKVTFGAFSYGHTSGPNGTGALAHISLTAQHVGSSLLDLQGVLVSDTEANQQTPVVQDGTVIVGALPTATATPTPTSTSTTTPTPTPTMTATPMPTHKIYLPMVTKNY